MIKTAAKRFLSASACVILALGLLPATASPAYAAEPITLSGNVYTENPGEGFTFSVYFHCNDCPKNGGESCRVYPGTDDMGHSFEITNFSYSISGGVCSFTISASGSSCHKSNLTWNYETSSWYYDCASPFQRPNIQSFVIASPDDAGPKDAHFKDSISVYLKRAITAHQGDATCITESPCALCGTPYTNPKNHDKAPNCEPTADKSAHIASYPCCGATATEEHAFGPAGFCACGMENIAPVGSIIIEGGSWSKTWSAATPWANDSYQLFCKDGASVTVKADGTGSQVAKVEYVFSEEPLDANSLTADRWTTVNEADGEYSFSIDPQRKGAVYVRITDECGNQALINSEGFVVYSDSKAVTTEAIYIRGSEKNPAFEIELNGNDIACVMQGDSYISDTDWATTSTGLELASRYIEEAPLGDDPVFIVYLNPLGERFAYDGVGFGRTAESEGDIPSTLALTLHIRDAWVPTDNVNDVEGVTSDNVKLEDQDALEKAKQDLEDALADETKNYDDDSKLAMEEDLARINEALKVIEDVENAVDLTNALPETITAGDAAAVKKAADAYAALTEHGKSLVSEDAKAKLVAAEEALEKALEAEKNLLAATGDTSPAAPAFFAMLFAAAGALIVQRKARDAF